MSSILRALKKLDEESGEKPEIAAKQNLRHVVERRQRTPWRIHQLVMYGAVVISSFIAIWVVIRSYQSTPVANTNRTTPVKQTETPVQSYATTEPIEKAPVKSEQNLLPKPVAPPPTQTQVNREPTSTVPEKSHSEPVVKTPATAMRHPQLVLNGTLWSEIPERRVALINDRYLKEGDNVDGATILRITKDSVTLQQGQETWTITVKK